MARTTSELVGGIIEVDATISLTPFILVANELVTEKCTGTQGPTTAYSDERLEVIERWLAAHFYAIRDTRVASESAGVSASYQYKLGLNMSVTMYGQQAMLLDTNGQLAKLSKGMEDGKVFKPSILWAGTSYE